MKKHTLLAAALFVAGSASASSLRDYADVIEVREQFETVNRPVERCRTETIERAPKEHSAAGGIGGAIVGGILGNQVGGGSGRAVATGVGVIAGAIAGDRLVNGDADAPQREEVRRCRQTDRFVQESTGQYEVTYRYGNRLYTAILPRQPGRVLEVDVTVTPSVR